MENTVGRRLKVPPFAHNTDQNTDTKALEHVRSMARIHSWPFLLAKEGTGVSSKSINTARTLWESPVSIVATSSTSLLAPATRQKIYLSAKSAELPGSPDVFPEVENLTHAGPFTPEEAAPRLPARPRIGAVVGQTPESFRLASRPPRPSSLAHAQQHLRHRAGSNDLQRHYTLKEALELLAHETYGSSDRLVLDSTTGRIVSPPVGGLQERLLPRTEVLGNETDEAVQRASRFYSQEPCQNMASQKTHIESDRNAKPPTRKFINKLARPLTWFHFKLSKRSARQSEAEKPVEISQPFNPRQFPGRVADSQNHERSDPFRHSPSHGAQMIRLERDAHTGASALVRRLSITDSFGPTLAESIEEAMVSSMSPFSKTISYQPLPSASTTPFPDWPTNQTVRFHEPERHQLPRLRIQISPSPSYLSSAYTYHPSRPLRSPPPRLLSPSPEQSSVTHLSLRGGCLPTPKTRNPPARRRIHPDHRPANNIPVLPRLWYLAGGRPVVKDKPGQPCYHGQPKPKRRFQNNQGLQDVDVSHQRIPNAEPCEPLTFGHLRGWKRASRPADRLNPQTGHMEPGRRSYWQGFAYSASRGHVGSGRPGREQGNEASHFDHGQGMDGVAGGSMDGGHGMGMGMGQNMDAGAAQPDHGVSGGLGPDGDVGNGAGNGGAAGHAA